jgi:Pvc16 N-terminal domain/IPT/TIG domain
VIAGSGPLGVLAGSDLGQQLEPVRFTLVPLDIENLHRVWSLFHGIPFAMSVAYSASTVLLDADMVPSRAPPARVAVVGAVPSLPPSIESLTPPVVRFGAGATLTAHGAGLGATDARLRLDSIEATTIAGDGSLVATIPAGLRAGVHSVRVVTGDATAPIESAAAVFVLAPRVADGVVHRASLDPQTGGPIETITVNLAPTPAFTQPVQLFLNPLRSPGAAPSAPDAIPGGSLTPLRFQIASSLAEDLNGGRITPEFRGALAENRITLGEEAHATIEANGVWRIADKAQRLLCRLEQDGEHITVHFALAADDALGTLVFRVRDVRPGRYLVSVQIGERSEATSEMRWGVLLFARSAPTDDLDQGRLPAAVASAFAEQGITLSRTLTIARPIPGDGWEIHDRARRRRFWASSDGGVISVYELDVADATFFGPLVTVAGG